MTVRQLYYTSCEHGRDGIYGFQVNAATPDLPKALEDAAVSASSYEPSAELLGRTPEPEPAEHPVALGYQRVGDGAVVHRSVYAGRDFTGRRGNYFAHALTLDHLRELAGRLPVELWRSAVWAERPVDDPVLPRLDALPPGSGVGGEEVRRLVAREPGRFAELLGAVQAALAASRGRVVARTSSDAEAALWVSAVTRSLPPPAALEATFTTWTARPDDADVVLACTTPDVRIGGYASTVVDLTADGGGPHTVYSTLLTEAWSRGQAGVDQVHALAGAVRPPLAAADLEDFAAAARILGSAGGAGLTDAELLGALRFVAARMPGRSATAGAAWQRVRDRLARPDVDLALVATALRDAGSPSAVPPEVLHDYVAALVRALLGDGEAPTNAWWPAMSREQAADIARRVVLPTLLAGKDGAAPAQERVEAFCDNAGADLMRALAHLLDANPAVHDRELVGRLPLALARRLSSLAADGSHVHRLLLTVRARHGEVDRVDALQELLPAVRRRPEELRTLHALWAGGVPIEDAERLLESVAPADLAATGLPTEILATLTADAASGELGPAHGRAAKALCRDHRGEVTRTTEPVLEAIARGVEFGEQPDLLRESDALAALRYVGPGSPLTAVAQNWLTEQVVRWALQLPPAAHYRVISSIAPRADRSVLPRYAELATTFARDAGADEIARLAAVWLAVPDNLWRDRLVNRVLPSVLAKRRRDVERIAKIFARRPKDLRPLLDERGGPSDAWAEAWDIWRDRYERPSKVQRLAAVMPWGRKD